MKGPGETPIEVFSTPSVEENPDSLMKLIRLETPLVRRLILLKFGCELHPKALSRVCGVSVRQAEGQLNRFFRRLKRRLPQGERVHLDARLKALCREELQSLGAPDLGALYRAFEAEAAGSDRPMGRMALGRLPGWRRRCCFCCWPGFSGAWPPLCSRPHPGRRRTDNPAGRRITRSIEEHSKRTQAMNQKIKGFVRGLGPVYRGLSRVRQHLLGAYMRMAHGQGVSPKKVAFSQLQGRVMFR